MIRINIHKMLNTRSGREMEPITQPGSKPASGADHAQRATVNDTQNQPPAKTGVDAKLEPEQNAVVEKWDAMVSVRDAVVSDHHSVVSDRDSVSADCDAAVADRDIVVPNHEADHDYVNEERDVVYADYKAMYPDCSADYANQEAMNAYQCGAVYSDHDSVVSDRDATYAGHESVHADRESSYADYDAMDTAYVAAYTVENDLYSDCDDAYVSHEAMNADYVSVCTDHGAYLDGRSAVCANHDIAYVEEYYDAAETCYDFSGPGGKSAEAEQSVTQSVPETGPKRKTRRLTENQTQTEAKDEGSETAVPDTNVKLAPNQSAGEIQNQSATEPDAEPTMTSHKSSRKAKRARKRAKHKGRKHRPPDSEASATQEVPSTQRQEVENHLQIATKPKANPRVRVCSSRQLCLDKKVSGYRSRGHIITSSYSLCDYITQTFFENKKVNDFGYNVLGYAKLSHTQR